MSNRREFITLVGGAVTAVWPLTARAQQPAMPVIGFLHPTSLEAFAENLRGFRQGLKETGYVEGENVTVEYRWANSQLARLPELAADLVRRRVAVIATASPPAAFAAKEAIRNDPDCLRHGARPCEAGIGREPRASRRQSDRNQFSIDRISGKAAGTATRNVARRKAVGCSRQPGPSN